MKKRGGGSRGGTGVDVHRERNAWMRVKGHVRVSKSAKSSFFLPPSARQDS